MHKCKRCKHEWASKKIHPKQCPRCKTPYWDKDLQRIKGNVIGEIRQSGEIGYQGTHKRIWHACEDCGKERWVYLDKGKPISIRCHKCASKLQSGENHPHWKGGRNSHDAGYITIVLSPDDPYYPMARKYAHQTYEHRLVMARHLGRLLTDNEIVHHLNGLRDDNRIENLILTTKGKHEHHTLLKLSQQRIRELEEKLIRC